MSGIIRKVVFKTGDRQRKCRHPAGNPALDQRCLKTRLSGNGCAVKFEIISEIENIEVISVGTGIRNLAYPGKTYGSGR